MIPTPTGAVAVFYLAVVLEKGGSEREFVRSAILRGFPDCVKSDDRTQPGLPLKKGRCGTMTRDYKRNGTATLFAAMSTLDGTVISMCDDRHRHQEWLKFLRVIDDVTPPDKDLPLIADNYATRKHPKVQKWLARHPRFHVCFTPTSSSWLNMVERFFRDLTEQRLRRGIFRDVEELVIAIGDYQ